MVPPSARARRSAPRSGGAGHPDAGASPPGAVPDHPGAPGAVPEPPSRAARDRAARRALAASIPHDALRALHRLDPWRHVAVAARVAGLGALAFLAVAQTGHPWLWPLAVAWQGATVFACTVLLHEVVHDTVLPVAARRRHPWLPTALAWAYALPAGLSPTQFTRWHLDHHAHLGSSTDDPKRAHLSPRRNARWLKLLYFTPALFAIYARASGRAVAAYPPELRRRVALERRVAIVAHLCVFGALAAWGGWGLALRAHVAPIFLAFPVWFALNRVGQHYDVDPADPARWTTRMRRSRAWEFVFLWSNHHLEHHALPRVPFYRLVELHARSAPFAARHGLAERTYAELLWGWLVRNQPPHARWTER